MHVTYTFRHLDSTEGMKTAIEDKLSHLEPFLKDSAELRVIFDAAGGKHRCELNAQDKGIHTSVHEDSDDMYKSIASAVSKLERQLRRNKERRKAHR